MMAGRGGQRSRLWSLTFMTVIHNNEEYGYGSLYLRTKGHRSAVERYRRTRRTIAGLRALAAMLY